MGKSAPSTGKAACPSAACEPGSRLHGLFGPDGELIRLSPPLEVDQAFVDSALEGRSPTKRFRFTSDCAEHRCGQWQDGKCGVAVKARAQLAAATETGSAVLKHALPGCAIRASCRWFAQEGGSVCRVCSLVVTDQG